MRGKIGELVFKRYGEGVIVGRRADPTEHPPTPSQMVQREQFRLAALYGKSALADPATRSLYETAAHDKGIPLFALTVADFFHEPVVEQIDLSHYTGKTGEPIRIMASDDFAVTGVGVTIRKPDGTVLEQGSANVSGNDSTWTYAGRTNLPAGQTVSIEVTAADHPGHKGTKTTTKTM